MKVVNLQLDTSPSIAQDLRVTLIHEASGREVKARPFLDGSVQVSNLDPGAWRVKVNHPNLVTNVVDQRIQVFPDRSTFVPIKVPKDLFSNTPVRDIPDQDLSPEQKRLDESAQKADAQAKKKAGQPLLADDWNELAFTMSEVARSTRDLSAKVAPKGHDHPELVEKIDEVQRNLNNFFEAFGKTVSQLQRQIQFLALQRRVDDVVSQLPANVGRERYSQVLNELHQAADENPYVYTSRLQKAGSRFTELLAEDVPATSPISNREETKDLHQVVEALRNVTPTHSFEAELQVQRKVENTAKRRGLDLALNPKGRG